MNRIYITLLSMVVAVSAMASGQWTIQGRTYTVDTLYHAQVGPGTTYTKVRATGYRNWNVFYSTTDLTAPYVEMRAVMANDKIASVATVSKMASAHNAEGALHFAGVNADFFGNNAPIGTTVVDGEVYYASNNGWTHWAIDENNVPHLGSMTVGGSVVNAAGSASHTIAAFNRGRGENELIVFTPKFGTTTATNQYGCEVLLTPVDGNIAFGKSVRMKVTGAPDTAGSMAIPSGCYVLSGHGTAKTFVNGLTDGEIITVNASLSLGETSIAATQVLGGQPMILSGGTVLNTESALEHLIALNPRTAVGHDATGTKLVMLVVDGRNTGVSDGCVSKELADIMREVGCTEAMNFDGGGSSTFYVDEFGVVNRTSDGSERAVTNALFAVATSPTDNEIASVKFLDNSMELPKYGYYTPTVYGYNKYGVLVDTDVKGYTLSCPSQLGEIVENGASLFANGEGYHVLTVTYGNATDAIPVLIGSGSPEFKHESVVVDSYNGYSVEVVALVNGKSMPLDNSALTWTSEDESIAAVDEAGVVRGIKNGTTRIFGAVGDISDTLEVVVEIPEARYMPIDPDLDVATWSMTSSMIKTGAAISSCGESGIAFDFAISSARGPYIGAAKNVRIWSRPDSLQLKIKTGTVTIEKISLNIVAGFGAAESVWKTFEVAMAPSETPYNWMVSKDDLTGEPGNWGACPITIKGINLYVKGTAGVAQRIEISEMNGVYTCISDDAGVETVVADADVKLVPNVVNTGETVAIKASGDCRYAVVSVNGMVVAEGAGNVIGTAGLSEGMYIVKVETGNGVKSSRLIVR